MPLRQPPAESIPYTPTVEVPATTAQEAVQYVGGMAAERQIVTEERTVTQEEVDQGYLILTSQPEDPAKVDLTIYGGPRQRPNVDFAVSGNVLLWTQLALATLLRVGDAVSIQYRKAGA